MFRSRLTLSNSDDDESEENMVLYYSEEEEIEELSELENLINQNFVVLGNKHVSHPQSKTDNAVKKEVNISNIENDSPLQSPVHSEIDVDIQDLINQNCIILGKNRITETNLVKVEVSLSKNLHEEIEGHSSSILDSQANNAKQEISVIRSTVMLKDWGPRLQKSNCYCNTCQILFPTSNSLKAHHVATHVAKDKPGKNKSKKAVRRVTKAMMNTSKFPIKSSLRTRSKSKGTFCEHCNKTFPNETSLISHSNKTLTAKNVPCKMCHRVVNKDTELKRHVESRHNEHDDVDDNNLVEIGTENTQDTETNETSTLMDVEIVDQELNGNNSAEDDVARQDYENQESESHLTVGGKTESHSKNLREERSKRLTETRQNEANNDREDDLDDNNDRLFYKCDICTCYFVYKNRLVNHRLEMHSQGTTYAKRVLFNSTCDTCGSQLIHNVTYNWHVISNHPSLYSLKRKGERGSMTSNSTYKCTTCGEEFFNYCRAKYHKKTKHPELLNKKDSKGSLRKVDKLQENAKYKCLACDKIFIKLGNAKYHIHRKHPDMFNKKGIKKIYRIPDLTSTRDSSTDEANEPSSKYKCMKCGDIFVNLEKAQYHKRSKHPEMLNEKVIAKINIIPDSSSQDPYPDPISTSAQDSLNLRNRSITPNSSEVNSSKASENSHIFKCLLCGELFTTRANAKGHKKRVHPAISTAICIVRVKKPIPKKQRKTSKSQQSPKYKCLECSQVFGNIWIAQYHKKTKHPDLLYMKGITKIDSLIDPSGPGNSSDNLISSEQSKENRSKPSGVKHCTNDIRSDPTKSYDDLTFLFQCCSCTINFLSYNACKTHYQDYHKKEISTNQISENCDICDLVFASTSVYRHKHLHHKILQLSAKELTIIKTDIPLTKNLYECERCDVYFSTKDEYTKHHSEGSHSVTKIPCDICHYNFTQVSLRRHACLHHGLQKCSREDFQIMTPAFPQELNDSSLAGNDINAQGNEDQGSNDGETESNKLRNGYKLTEKRKASLNIGLYDNSIYLCSKGCGLHHLSLKTHKKHIVHCIGEGADCAPVCEQCGLKFTALSLTLHRYIHHDRLKLQAKDFRILTNDDVKKSSVTFSESMTEDLDRQTTEKQRQPSSNTSENTGGSHKYTELSNYECKWSQRFLSSLNLDDYGNILYRCKICKKHYMTLSTVNRHSHDVLGETCPDCGLLFTSNIMLKHQYIHHKRLDLNYEDFSIQLDYGSRCSNHKCNYPLFKCTICDTHFIRFTSAQAHTDERCANAKNTGQICKSCGLKFLADCLKIHEFKHHYQNKVTSFNIIKYSGASRKELNTHYSSSDNGETQGSTEKGNNTRVTPNAMESSDIVKSERASGKGNDVLNTPNTMDMDSLDTGDTERSTGQANDAVCTPSTKDSSDISAPEKANESEMANDVSEASNTRTKEQLNNRAVTVKAVQPVNADSNRTDRKVMTKIFKCGDCNVFYLTKNTCYRHMINHKPLDSIEQIECKLCGLQFPTAFLHKHIICHHKRDFNMENVFVEEYRTNGEKLKVNAYKALDKIQSRLVSTTTDSGGASENVDSTVNDITGTVDQERSADN